jgi:hypothetical protein
MLRLSGMPCIAAFGHGLCLHLLTYGMPALICAGLPPAEAIYLSNARSGRAEYKQSELAFIDHSELSPPATGAGNFLFQREAKQTSGCHQELVLTHQVFIELNERKEERIQFNADLVYPFDFKGTCTAMALDFLARSIISCAADLRPAAMRSLIKSFRLFYRASNTTYTSRQAAFNSIEIIPTCRRKALEDQEINKWAKMQSLASYHNIVVCAATPSLPMPKVKKGSIDLAPYIDDLPQGYYIVRMLTPMTKNARMELFGHTMILIKGFDLSIFYDNFAGALEIPAPSGEKIKNYLRHKWPNIQEIRIYNAMADKIVNICQENS